MELMILLAIGIGFYGIGSVFNYFMDTDNRAKVKRDDLVKLNEELRDNIDFLKQTEKTIKSLHHDFSKGFPLLADAFADYHSLYDGSYAHYLINKKRPATSSAELVREMSKEKTAAIRRAKIAEYQLKYYESVFPFLEELKEETPTIEDLETQLGDLNEEERDDPVSKFLTKEEYKKLSTAERNQLALDRYWESRHKSLWAIGKLYESYIGYLYESDGWQVEYFGIDKRYDDLGRDLIAKKDDICHIIQCKNWSQFKTIYENHIFQLFGTTYEYQNKNKKLKVVPVFYTSTNLSDTAREFSKRLGIEVHENIKLQKYPCIKCNISRVDNSHIYHLPFDQQYDNTVIELSKGEMYCLTTQEAESAGFRRAYKWHGNKG